MLLEKYFLEYHRTLNQKLFDGETLNEEVRQAFLRIAHEWMNYANIPESAVTDIIFTGGNCNFNYSRFSDCDVHIVYDTGSLSRTASIDFWSDYLSEKKSLWAKNHHITVKGYSVELYAQSSDDKLVASGVYSIERNGWIRKPVHGTYNFKHDPALIKKVEDTKKTLDSMMADGVPSAQFKVMKDKLKDMRSASLASGDEFSFDNLVFKALRNTGVLDKMNEYLAKRRDKELSL